MNNRLLHICVWMFSTLVYLAPAIHKYTQLNSSFKNKLMALLVLIGTDWYSHCTCFLPPSHRFYTLYHSAKTTNYHCIARFEGNSPHQSRTPINNSHLANSHIMMSIICETFSLCIYSRTFQLQIQIAIRTKFNTK